MAAATSDVTARRMGGQAGEALAYPRLDVLVNDAGGFWAMRRVTADGLEQTLAVSHLTRSYSPAGWRPAPRPGS
jgi:NAD(P)-dependent dehydrogenase (short-subunit alcohol dehydrogenase family)